MQPTPPPEEQQPYGQPPPPPPGQPVPGGVPAQPSNGLGLAAMIVGIISIPLGCCLWFLGIPAGIAAAVMGFLGKKKAEQGEATNRGQAMAGLICGVIGAALGLLVLVLVVIANVIDLNLPTAP